MFWPEVQAYLRKLPGGCCKLVSRCYVVVGTQSGEPIVPMYDWATFLGHHFRNVPHLKLHHYFTFTSELPGKVFLREFSDTASSSYQTLTGIQMQRIFHVSMDIHMTGQIREFCRPGTDVPTTTSTPKAYITILISVCE